MNLDIYYIDAFTDKQFSGNPAAVIFSELADESIMQNIAAENNLSETVFINLETSPYTIKWFSPKCEVSLCGHATLAAAYVYFKYIDQSKEIIDFISASGDISVLKKNDMYYLDFPRDNYVLIDAIEKIKNITAVTPSYTFLGDINMMAVFKDENEIRSIDPNIDSLLNLEGQGLIVTSRGHDCDFVSRYFCPKYGIAEDPVTGSAHTTLIPYWSKVLNKDELHAKQLSHRGGELLCKNKVDRVSIGGKAVLYMKGQINIS